MMGFTMSIVALHNCVIDETHDTDVWKNFVVPDGMDKDKLINLILFECGEFELLYPNWDFMQNMIGVWSSAELSVWTRLHNTEMFEYDPLSSFDVVEEASGTDSEEETTETAEASNKSVRNNNEEIQAGNSAMALDRGKSVVENGSTRNDAGSISSGRNDESSTQTESVAAFNASTLQVANGNNTINSNNSSEVKNSNENEIYSNGQVEHVQDNSTENNSNTKNKTSDGEEAKNAVGSETRSNTRIKGKFTHTHGNMGSFSYQSLIKEEREVAEFHTDEYIVNSFKERFCILVY